VKLLLEEGAELESNDTKYGRTPRWVRTQGGGRATAREGAELGSKDTECGLMPLS
jgi:hypothetical protein